MPNPSVPHLVETIRQRNLLKPRHMEKLTQSLQGRFQDANALLQDLMRRGWLTPQQAGQLLGAPVSVPVGLPVPPSGVPVGLPVPPPGVPMGLPMPAPAVPMGQPVAPTYQNDKQRSRYRWIQWNLVGLTILIGLGLFLWHVVSRQQERMDNPTPEEELADRSTEAQEKLNKITGLYADPYFPAEQLRQHLQKFRNDYPEVPQAVKAAEMIADLPSPLDSLDRSKIPPEELFQGQPKNLVAILGERRWRHWSAGRHVDFSPDGSFVASAGDDGKLLLWVRKTGLVQGTLNLNDVRSLHFTLDGNLLTAGDGSGKITLWQLRSGQQGSVQGPVAKPTAITASLQGQLAASAAEDSTIKLWDPASGEAKANLAGHRSPVRALAFAPNAQWLASGGEDSLIKLWTVAGNEIVTFEGGTSPVRAVTFSPDSKYLAAAGDDAVIRVFDLSNPGEPKELEKMTGHEKPITTLAFAGNNKVLVSAADDGNVMLWDVSKQGAFLKLHLGKIHEVACNRNIFATLGEEGIVRIWNLIDTAMNQKEGGAATIPVGQGQENHLSGHTATGSAVAFLEVQDTNQMTIASASWDRTLRFWNLATTRERSTPCEHDTAITAMAYSPSLKRVVSGSSDGVVKVWDSTSFKEIVGFPFQGSIQALAFVPEGTVFAVGTAQQDAAGELRLVDTIKQGEAAPASGNPKGVHAVAFSPVGGLVYVGGGDGLVQIRSRHTGQERGSLKNDTAIEALAVSPRGKLLVTADQGRKLKFWDLDKMKERNAATDELGYVSGMAFSPDGKKLVTSHHEGRVVLWDPDTGKKLDEFTFPGAIRAVAFAPDSRHVVTANANGTLYILRLASPPPRKK